MHEHLYKIFRYVALGGIFLLTLTPFVVIDSLFFPFITGKNFFFRILTEIVFFSWALLALYVPQYRPKKSLLMWGMVAFVAIIGTANLFGEYFPKSFWSNFERMEGYVTLLHLLGLFVATGAIITTEKLWQKLLTVSTSVSLILGVYGLFQLAGWATIHQGGVRLDASFGNATYLAIYMVFHLFFTAWLLYKNKNTFLRWGFSLLMLLQMIILYYTATRGAILGFVGGVFLTAILFAFFGEKGSRFRKIASSIVLGVVVLGSIFFAVRDTALIQSSAPLARIANISLTDKTVASRFLIWDMAWEGVKERPFLGWGQDNFIYVFGKYYNPEMYDQEPWFDRAHNIVFDWLIAGGFLGLLSYLSLFVFALYYLWRSGAFDVFEKCLFTGLLAGYGFNNLFVFDNITSYIIFILVLAFVHAKAVYGSKKLEISEEERINSAPINASIKYTVASLLVILFFTTFYFFSVRGIVTARVLLQAVSPQEAGPSKNLELFIEAGEGGTLGKQEVRERLAENAFSIITSNLDQETKLQFVDTAVEELKKHIALDPQNPRLSVILGTLLLQAGAYEEGRQELQRALVLAPGKQIVLLQIGNSYLLEGRYAEAEEILKKTFDVTPDYDQARFIYASSLIYQKKFTEVDALLESIDFSSVARDGNILNAYVSVGKYDRVIAIWENLVNDNPNNPDFNLSLGAAYYSVGRIDDAVRQVEKAILLKPEFEEQGRQIIEQIRAGTIQL
jgi:O-antigen ligase